MNLRSSLIALALVAPLAACDPTSDDPPGGGDPTAVDATFTVTEIDNMRVPILETYDVEPFPGCEKLRSGGHLVLFADGRYSMRLGEETVLCDGTPRGSGWLGGTGRYVRAGDKITLSFDVGRPDMTGTYSPTGGGTIDGTNFPGPTPIPAITLDWNGRRYLLVQESEELATRP
jgi:hypothetical protein